MRLTAVIGEIEGDARRLQQVILNVLANADQAVADSRDRRDIYVSSQRDRSQRDGSRVLIEISDTGHGIAPADLARVFEPMYTTHAQQGRKGYGLSIARQIVEEHGGTLTVRSALGQGTTFTISLPTLRASSGAFTPVRPVVAIDEPLLTGVDDAAPSRGRLLVVEDERTLRTAVSRYLRRQGYDVEAVESGAEALGLATRDAFDLILLDLRLQDMSGDEVFRTLEADAPLMAARVVFMTGDLNRPGAADFVHASARPVIAKPFQLSELQALVEQVLTVRRRGEAAQPTAALPDDGSPT